MEADSERALILAPVGRDAQIASQLLVGGGFSTTIVPDIPTLAAESRAGAALAIIAAEALAREKIGPFASVLSSQPAWSDLPIIVLTQRGGLDQGLAPDIAEALGNVSFLERPFRPATLVSVAKTGLRGRKRQYQTRAYLEELRDSEARYRTALRVARSGAWETDYVKGERTWTEEGMDLFGISPPEGLGHVGGENDEYRAALHPEDRHLADRYRELADLQDSFDAEYRVLRPDGSIAWLTGRGQVTARGIDGKAHKLISIMTDITQRKETEEHVRLLMLEISHRSKNLLAVIQSIAGQTARSAGTLEEFEGRFTRRLHGLAASHDILVDQGWQGAPLAQLVRSQAAPFVEAGSGQLHLEGPDVVVTAQAAQAIGLALHELATNAARYGALSAPTGCVHVSWVFQRSGGARDGLRLDWREEGGPAVTRPVKKGFGHVVVERMVASALDAEVELDFASSGLRWTLTIPGDNIVALGDDGARAAPAGEPVVTMRK